MRHVKTRTSTQSRSHAQKFLGKIKRKGVTLVQFLESIDFDNLEKLPSCEIGYDEDLDLMLKVGKNGREFAGDFSSDDMFEPGSEDNGDEPNSSIIKTRARANRYTSQRSPSRYTNEQVMTS